jgi:prefoldin subunit 5
MADWEQQLASLQTDIKHMLNSQDIMQKQIRDLQKFSSMGAGGLKALVVVGIVLGIAAKWMGFFD